MGHPLKPYEEELKGISTITTTDLFEAQNEIEKNSSENLDGKEY